jgi:hypothetical protein
VVAKTCNSIISSRVLRHLHRCLRSQLHIWLCCVCGCTVVCFASSQAALLVESASLVVVAVQRTCLVTCLPACLSACLSACLLLQGHVPGSA